MKRYAPLFVLTLLLVAGCGGDDITEELSADCTDINSDLTALQALVAEKDAGSTVISVEENTFTFSSGTSVTVPSRSGYGLGYNLPVVGLSDGCWSIDGTSTRVSATDELLKIKTADGYWHAWYGGTWNALYLIETGTDAPLFSGWETGEDGSTLTVSLTQGASLTFDFYTGSESLSLSSSSWTCDKDGGSTSVTVAANTAWTAASSDASWLTLSPDFGSDGETAVTVTATANDSYTRTGVVTFTTGNISAKLTVVQTGETGGGVIDTGDTEDSDDNIAKTTFDRTVSVVYSSGGAVVSGTTSDFTVTLSGNDVTIVNGGDEVVIYELSGTTSDGFFKLYSGRKQAIVLNGVSLTNRNGAAINVQGPTDKPSKGKRTFVVVYGTNSLADGSSYTDTPSTEDEKAAFFSEGQLVFSGDGTLTVTATGKAGITSDDYVRFMSAPTVKVTSSAGHGVRGKDAVIVSNGTISSTVTAAMKKGMTSDSLVAINGGVTTIKVSGKAGTDTETSSTGADSTVFKNAAGIKADQRFEMNAGTLNITSSGNGGKGISGDSLVVFNGGTAVITVTGGVDSATISNVKDFKGAAGVKADQRFEMNDGSLTITSSGAGGKGISGDAAGFFKGGTVSVKVTGSNYGKSSSSSGGVPGGGGRPGQGGTTSSSSDNSVAAKGIKFDGNLTISGGTLTSIASNHEAIEAKGTIEISGGYVYAQSSDDAINAGGNATVTGGYVCANSTGNDGFDANGNLYIKGGVVYAIGAKSPEVALDANTEGGYKLYIQGGTLITCGPLESKASLSQTCYKASSYSAGTWYALYNGSTLAAVVKTPSSISNLGSGMIVSTSGTPSLKSGVTVSGGTSIFEGMGCIAPTVSGGSTVSLSKYSN